MRQTNAQVIRIPQAMRSMAQAVVYLLLCSLAMMMPRSAHSADVAPCSDATLKRLGEYLGAAQFVRPSQDGATPGLVIQDVCKIWPGDPGIMLALAAYVDEPVKDGDMDSWSSVIAMVDTSTGKIVAAAKGGGGQKDALSRFGGYVLDTAPYRLAPSVRAFGVIDKNTGPGPDCADGRWSSELTLWIRDKQQLRAVFSASLEESTTIKGSGCATSEPGRVDEAHMTVAVGKTRTNGFADLMLVAHVTPDVWDEYGNHRQGSQRIERMLFKYDGKSYGGGPSAFWWSSEK